MSTQAKLNPLWLKAAVVGSIWAAFEIIVGSFLHNMRLPFAGTILASASVFLLVSFMQLWKEHGIIIRAGIICALMKSISPSAIILGPMIGILLEALLLEAASFVFGKNFFGFLIGGALAVSSSLLQKILSYLIIYGYDLVAIAEAFYNYLIKQTNLPDIGPLYIILAAFIIYALMGIMSATWGYFAGRKHLGFINQENKILSLDYQINNKLFLDDNHGSHHPFPALALLIGGMVLALFMINSGYMLPSVIFGIAFISFGFMKYKPAFKRFKKPGIWLQFFIFTIIAAVSWEWIKTENFYSTEGLIVALKMNFRAMIVILGFAAISVELRSPVVKAILTRHGLSPVYKALNLSFAALPTVVSTMPGPKSLKKETRGILSNLFVQAQNLLEHFETKTNCLNHIFIITGNAHQGKTGYAKELAEKLKRNGHVVGGFVSHGKFRNNQRDSFEIENLKNGKTILLCKREPEEGWTRFGPFYFNPLAFKEGGNMIESAHPGEIVFVDELGKLELYRKGGWYPLILKIYENKELTQFWIVRKDYLPLLLANFEIPDKNIFDISQKSVSEIAERIIS